MNKQYKKLMRKLADEPRLKTNKEFQRMVRESIAEDVRQLAEIEAMTDADIAVKFDLSPSTIRKVRDDKGIHNGLDIQHQERDKNIVKVWNETHSTAQVAKVVGCQMQTARNHLRRLESAKRLTLGSNMQNKMRTNKKREFQFNDKRENVERGWKKAAAKNLRRGAGSVIRVSETDAKDCLERLFWSRVGPRMEGDAAYCVRRQVEKLRAKRNETRKALVT